MGVVVGQSEQSHLEERTEDSYAAFLQGVYPRQLHIREAADGTSLEHRKVPEGKFFHPRHRAATHHYTLWQSTRVSSPPSLTPSCGILRYFHYLRNSRHALGLVLLTQWPLCRTTFYAGADADAGNYCRQA